MENTIDDLPRLKDELEIARQKYKTLKEIKRLKYKKQYW